MDGQQSISSSWDVFFYILELYDMIDDSWYHQVESFGQTQEHVHIFTSLHDSVLGYVVGFAEVWNVSMPGLQKSGENGLVPVLLGPPSPHFTSEDALLLDVRLRASEARKESALILELMLR